MRSWREWFTGSPEEFPLRNLVLNRVLAITVIVGVFFFLFDMIFAFSLFRLAFDVVTLGLFTALFLWVRFGKGARWGMLLASVAGLLFEVTNFFGNGGSQGSSWMLTITILGVFAVIHESRRAWWFCGAAVLLLGLCLTAESLHPEWVVPYLNGEDKLVDLVLTFVFCGSLLFVLVLLVMRSHGESTEQIRRALSVQTQTEKLAALGETMASLNHEISNPLGIMDLALTTARTWWEKDLPRLTALIPQVPVEAEAGFWSFVTEGCSEVVRGDRAERKARRKAFEEQFRRLNWADPEDAADQLADFFSGAWDPAWEAWLTAPAGPELFAAALRFFDMASSYRSVSVAHGRLMSLVSSLARYARFDAHTASSAVRLDESLDLVLDLFVGHRNKNVEIVRRYAEVPPVLARQDELIQVWTNLVKNALSAMDDQGTLSVTLERDPVGVRVSIDDSGPGVPEEWREKIFEPFFTSKGPEKGTGLGLAIVRRIVGEHHGTVEVSASPLGGARFVVRLPLSTTS